MPTLYLIATPIGNLNDLSPRAISTLKSVDLILCEDTRRTGLLLNNLGINKPLLSYFEHNEVQRIPEIVRSLLAGKSAALVSDAGTPTISDPGYKLVRECLANNFNVISIPGPSAILTALAASGFPTDRFCYLGFLSHKESQKNNLFSDLLIRFAGFPTTFICFESPYRLQKTLRLLSELSPECRVVVARELTKIHEEFIRLTAKDALDHFTANEPRGEITLLFRFA
ncbi:MAG: 16S rRNA (cytidine(1402)-2'-O)-methyltransferase [Patescibacteria group bacterium]